MGETLHFRQTILSQLYLDARALSEGSMMPPRRRRTRWRVDSWFVDGQHHVFPRSIPKGIFCSPLLLLHSPQSPSTFFLHPISRSKSPIGRSQKKKNHLLDIIIRQRPTVLQLLAREDQPLLVGRDAFLVLDLGLDIVDCVRGFDLEGDSFAREGFYEAGVPGFLDLCGVDRVEGRRRLTSALWVGVEEGLVWERFYEVSRGEVDGWLTSCVSSLLTLLCRCDI